MLYKENRQISNIKCQLLQPNTFCLTLTLKGGMPEKVDYLKDLKQVRDVIEAFGLKFWEKLVIVETRIAGQVKKFIKLVLTIEKTIPAYEELPFFCLNHKGDSDTSKKLRATNLTDASIVAAEYAVKNDLAAVTAFYTQGNHEGMVRIVNFNIYKKLARADRKVEKFIGKTGCLLLKGFY